MEGKPLKGGHSDHHFNNRDEVGKEYGLSGSSVGRLLKVNDLIIPLRHKLDNGSLMFKVGIQISFLTEEEQQAQAAINHSCNGIYVSGIELPWYVQFRASAGADYEFSNEDTAEIFKSYEFELWDLKNHVPYMIPDGEYISVTVPVKAGYDYTVEHILGNGGTETIVPDVNGSTLVFSTHSFSPFSIAGSQPLVGNDVAEKGYASPTPTPIKNSGTSGSSQTVGNTGSSGTANASGSSANSNSQNTYYDDSSDQQEDYSDDSQEDTSGTVKNAVKTGDDTQILPFVILVGAAVILIILVIFLKRKKK